MSCKYVARSFIVQLLLLFCVLLDQVSRCTQYNTSSYCGFWPFSEASRLNPLPRSSFSSSICILGRVFVINSLLFLLIILALDLYLFFCDILFITGLKCLQEERRLRPDQTHQEKTARTNVHFAGQTVIRFFLVDLDLPRRRFMSYLFQAPLCNRPVAGNASDQGYFFPV